MRVMKHRIGVRCDAKDLTYLLRRSDNVCHPRRQPKVDRLVLKTMGDESPKAQVSGGEAAIFNALKTTRSTLRQ